MTASKNNSSSYSEACFLGVHKTWLEFFMGDYVITIMCHSIGIFHFYTMLTVFTQWF